jgi:hypothetical protein
VEGVGTMREKPQDAGLEGVEQVPQSPRRAPAYCNSRVTEAQSPHTKQTAPPQVSPAGGRDPATSTFFLAGLQGSRFRGLQLRRLLPSQPSPVSRASCTPQKGKSQSCAQTCQCLRTSTITGCGVRGQGVIIGSSQGWKGVICTVQHT